MPSHHQRLHAIVVALTGACVAVGGSTPAYAAPAAVAPTSASPSETPEDTVRMNDGGMVRGRLREVVPGSHVVLQIGGEDRRIPWAEVAAVEEGGSAPVTRQRPRTSETTTPPPPPPGPTVHIDVTRGTRPVALAKTTAEASGFGFGFVYTAEAVETLCVSPCDRAVAAHGVKLHLVGDRIPRARSFYLESDVTHVDIEVRPGNRAGLIAGVVLTPLGGTVLGVGGMMFAFDAVDREDASDPDSTYSRNNPTRNGAIATTVIGSALFAIGIALLVKSATRYKLRKRRG